MANGFDCPYCGSKKPTSARGLNSHIQQTKSCREKMTQAAAIDSDSEIHPPAEGEEVAMDVDENAMLSDADIAADPVLPCQDAPSPPPAPPNRRATVEEVPDESMQGRQQWLKDELSGDRWIEDWPCNAGSIIGTGVTSFETYQQEQKANNQAPWSPFENKDEWEFARWIITSGVSQKQIDSLLKLNSIRSGADPSFHNARSLLKRIDALPEGPEWVCTPLRITGDKLDKNGEARFEEVELWHRDPVEIVKELIGNPAFEGKLCYKPHRVFKKANSTSRVYSDMWTGDWWREVQELLPDGATIAPVIISSDKTNLSRFSGDKQAWPVYLSIGNIEKGTRRKPTARATILLGYIPVTKLECFTKAKRSVESYQLFHQCMRIMLEPLVNAGKEGVPMTCADGFLRRVFPILAAYIVDYPEQCLVVCCRENSCPKCTVRPDQRGEYRVHSVLRDPEKTVNAIEDHMAGHTPQAFKNENLCPIEPFWKDMPHCNIFECMTPDILHQLHKGLFKDHIVSWATKATAGKDEEIDEHFRTMSLHPSLRHFKRGISLTSQWTGTEHKNMEKVFLGVIAGATDPRVIAAVRGVLDFIYYAHFETHSDESLAMLDAAWLRFHENKDIFEDLEIRQHFNISKLHSIKHYLDSIQSCGTADGFNTEGSERLHINLAKMGYNASNKKEYIKQMTTWLQRQELIHRFCQYLQWAVPGYVVEVGIEAMADGKEDEKKTSEGDDGEEEEVKIDQMISFHIAKKPAVVGASVKSIIDDFGVVDFLYYLEDFLNEVVPSASASLTQSTVFDLYKCLVLTLPPIPAVSSEPIRDVVHAVKGRPGQVTTKGIKKAVNSRFSTVLARFKEGTDNENGPLAGVRVAQVRLIFKLPASFGYPYPLAFVYWFKPLRTPSPDTGFYTLSYSTRSHFQHSSVIPVSDILRSCHLIPVFGRSRAVDLGWTSDQVLQQATSFYLNPYLRHYDFYHLRFLIDQHLQQECERQEELKAQRARARHAIGLRGHRR